jgi:hypothetical protein
MDGLRAYDQGAHIQHAIERRNNVGNRAPDGEGKTRTPGIRPQGNRWGKPINTNTKWIKSEPIIWTLPDLRLLTYVRELLRRLCIESTGLMLKARRGTIFYDPRMGKQYTHNKDAYVIYIRASSNMRFYRYVGFAITRKQAWLENYVKRNTITPAPPPTISHPAYLNTTLTNNN